MKKRYQIDQQRAVQQFRKLAAELCIPLRPRREVIAGRESIALLVVAPAIGDHEVMPQVHGMPRPRDEVIDLGCRRSQLSPTVKAPALLLEGRSYNGQGRSF